MGLPLLPGRAGTPATASDQMIEYLYHNVRTLPGRPTLPKKGREKKKEKKEKKDRKKRKEQRKKERERERKKKRKKERKKERER